MKLEEYKSLWFKSYCVGVFCLKSSKYFRRVKNKQYKYDEKEWIKPEICFKCDQNIINNGDCDPI